MNRDIILAWLEQVEHIEIGETIYIPTDSRKASNDIAKLFKKEIKLLSELDPVRGGRIFLATQARDGQWWITLTRVTTSPLIGFVKTKSGDIVRTTLEDPEKVRRLRLMREDGYTLEEIEEIEGKLTEEERRIVE